MMSTNAEPAESRIYKLAAQHGIVAELPVDDWADHVALLSDAEFARSLGQSVTLQRKGIITDREATKLLAGSQRVQRRQPPAKDKR